MEGVAKKGGQVVRQHRNWEKRESLLGGKDVVANVDGKGKGIEGIEFLQINRVNASSDIGEGRRVEPTIPLPRYIPLLRYPVIPNNPLRDGSRSFEKLPTPFVLVIIPSPSIFQGDSYDEMDFLLFVLSSLSIFIGSREKFCSYIYNLR